MERIGAQNSEQIKKMISVLRQIQNYAISIFRASIAHKVPLNFDIRKVAPSPTIRCLILIGLHKTKF